MIKKRITILLILITSITFAQNDIHWDGKYQLQLSDFKSPATQIGNATIYSINFPSGIEFSFSMSNIEFLFTKNFNSKINNVFKPKASSLVAPNEIIANDLKDFANFQFNLSELYARKFRKRIFEEKDTFSNVSFFKPIYDEIQNEFSERITIVGKETDLGRNKEKLKLLHEQVVNEIQELDTFCKECKVSKKKNK